MAIRGIVMNSVIIILRHLELLLIMYLSELGICDIIEISNRQTVKIITTEVIIL